jgi:hypothetical protein
MKRVFRMASVAVIGMAACSYGFAAGQIPAGATGQCKDGTYSMTATRQGACRGHQGIKDWYVVGPAAAAKKPQAIPAPAAAGPVSAIPAPKAGGVTAARPAPVAGATTGALPVPSAGGGVAARPVPATGAAPAALPAPATRSASSALPAPAAVASGGGPGMVWVNVGTKVYHCPGSHFYGTTKDGKYMSEADARTMGARADHNKPCVK